MSDLLEELIAAGTPARLVAKVAELAAEVSSARKRKAADAARQQRVRDKRAAASRDVTDDHVTARDVTPVHILSPKKKEPKRVLSMPIDPALELSEANLAYALSKGFDEPTARNEWQRFKDHYLASGKRMKDWDASWRSWVTSPFQQSRMNGNAANRHGKRTIQDAARDLHERVLAEELGDLARPPPLRLVP